MTRFVVFAFILLLNSAVFSFSGFATDLSTIEIIPVASQEIFKDRYYFRGDSRSPETIFKSGFEINPNKLGPKTTEAFGSGPEYLSFSSSFMGAAAFPILNEHNPEEQLEDSSYVYVIRRNLNDSSPFQVRDFTKESIERELQTDSIKTFDFTDLTNNLPVQLGPQGQILFSPFHAASIWGKILRYSWPREMVILNGKINPSQILGSFHIKRIRSPYTDTANLIQITQYTPNPMASESIDSGLLEISLTENQDRKWLLNLAMYNPVSFFDSTFFFYVDMLVAERDYKRERTADSIIQSLNAVQDRWIQEFYIGKGYNLLDKNFPGKKNFIH